MARKGSNASTGFRAMSSFCSITVDLRKDTELISRIMEKTANVLLKDSSNIFSKKQSKKFEQKSEKRKQQQQRELWGRED